MPFYPESDEDEGLPYDIEHYWEHTTADYLGISVVDVFDLDVIDFLALRREAFIAEMSKTEKGREYLNNCKTFESEDADFEGLEKLKMTMGGAA